MRDAIMRKNDFSFATRAVGYFIADHINFRFGYAYAGQDYLAELSADQFAPCSALAPNSRPTTGSAANLTGAIGFTSRIGCGSKHPTICRVCRPKHRKDLRQHRRQIRHRIGDKKGDPILSTDNSLKENLTQRSGQLDTPSAAASNDEGSGYRERGQKEKPAWQQRRDNWHGAIAKLKAATSDDGVAALPDQSAAITRQARRSGAPQFVFEGSEPWRAWTEYRKAHGIPGSLPTRQALVNGRWRTGWDAPTLFPPGYTRRASGS